jgi:cytochrome c553
MAIKIEKPIVDYKVLQNDPPAEAGQDQELAEVVQMHEQVARPPMLRGSTYKIKTPQSEHAMYVTINDIVLNEGTEHELRRPFEVFINSKNMDHFQWIVALTRIISAVFRKGGDVTFLVEELHSVFDPRGGYFKKGGKYMPSLVAELGSVIEQHLVDIGLLEKTELDDNQQAHIKQARAKFEKARAREQAEAEAEQGDTEFPDGATLCARCHTKAMVQLDGCMTCLNCGESKCG